MNAEPDRAKGHGGPGMVGLWTKNNDWKPKESEPLCVSAWNYTVVLKTNVRFNKILFLSLFN